MSDTNFDVDINLNTSEAKRDASEIKAAVRSVNEEAKKGDPPKNTEGILERIRRRISEIKVEADKAQSAMSLSKQNRELQVYEMELQRLGNLGRVNTERQNRLLAGQEGILQRLQRAAAIYSRGMMEATRPENLEKYSQKLALVNAEISKLTKGSAIGGGTQWNGLQHSVSQIARELPAMTYGFQTFAMAISNNIPMAIDEVARLRKENEALAASGKKGVPVWRQLLSSVASWQTLMMIGITLFTVYGKEIGNWLKGMFSAKKAIDAAKESQKAFNEALTGNEYQNAVKNLEELRIAIDLAKAGTISKKEVVDQYNKTLGDTVGHVKTLDEVERFMADNADNYIQMTLYKAAAQLQLAEAAKKAAEIQENSAKKIEEFATTGDEFGAIVKTGGFARMWNAITGNSNTFYDTEIENAGDKRKRQIEKQLQAEQDAYTENADKLMQKAAEYAKQMGALLFGSAGSTNTGSTSSAENKYRSLLQRIDDLDKEYARKKLEDDDAELQALRDKFAKIRKEVEAFNADKTNKIKIDIAGLDDAQKRAEANLKESQENERKRKELEKQAEALKKAMEDNATYEQKRAKIIEDSEKEITLLRSKGENERAEQARINRDAELRELEELEAQKIVLLYKGAKAQLVVTTASIKAQIDSVRQLLNSGNISDDFRIELERELKRLENVQRLGAKAATLANFKEEQQRLTLILNGLKAAGKENTEEYRKQRAELDKLNEESNAYADDGLRSLLQMFMRIAQELDGLGQSLQNLGDAFGNDTVGGIGSFLSGLASNIQNISIAFDEGAEKSDKYAAAVSSLIGMISMVADAAAERKRAEEEYYRSVIQLSHDYSLALNEQLRLQSELSESVYIKDYIGRVQSAMESGKNAMDEYQKGIQKLIDVGKAKTGMRNAIDWGNVGKGATSGAVIGGVAAGALVGAAAGSVVPIVGTLIGAAVGALIGIFAGKKKKDTYAAILGEYPEIVTQTADGLLVVNRELAEQLIANNALNEETKQILENILEWDDAVQAAMEQIRGVVSELSGQLGDDMRNALVSAFKAGENAALAMGKSVNKVLEDILANILFNAAFSDLFKDLEDQLTTAFALGDETKIIDAMADFLDNAGPAGEQFYKWMEWAKNEAKNRNLDIFSPDSLAQSNSTVGRIRAEITEQTGSEMVGLHRTTLDYQKRSYQVCVQLLELDKKRYDALLTSIRHLAAIETNTGHTVDELKKAVTELQAINKNTKQNSTSYDRP